MSPRQPEWRSEWVWMSFQWFRYLISVVLEHTNHYRIENLKDFENFESKTFKTLSFDQFSKTNITRECSIWKHSRHPEEMVIPGHTSTYCMSKDSYGPTGLGGFDWLPHYLTMEVYGHVIIVYFKLRIFCPWKYVKVLFSKSIWNRRNLYNVLESAESVRFNHVEYNLTFAKIIHWNLMIITWPNWLSGLNGRLPIDKRISPWLLSMLFRSWNWTRNKTRTLNQCWKSDFNSRSDDSEPTNTFI